MYCQNINFGVFKSRAAFGFVAPAKIIISKHHLRKSRQFSPPPCRFQPVQNLRDLRKRVRSRKTSEKLDQKAKETREERPRDGAGEAEGGEGRGPCRREAPPGPLGAPAPPLSRPPPPRPSASLLLSPLSSDQVIRRFSLNELFFEDLSSFELVGTASRSGFSGSVPLPGPVPPVRFSARLLAVPVHRGGFSGFRFGLAASWKFPKLSRGCRSTSPRPPPP